MAPGPLHRDADPDPAGSVAVAGRRGSRIPGLAGAEGLASARPEPKLGWRFGFPTTAFLLALAGAEAATDYPGLFTNFLSSLADDNPTQAIDVILWVVLAGALLALTIDLAGLATVDGTERGDLVSLTNSRLVVPALLFGGVLVAAAVVGLLAVDGDALERGRALAGPGEANALLGTGDDGRSTLSLTMAALGPALAIALIPGLVATVIGSLVAWLRLRLPRPAGRVLGALIDGAWWPTPFLLPLVVLAVGEPNRPEWHPEVMILLGLALTPAASRLLGRSGLAAPDRRRARLASVWLFNSALALAVAVLVGFAGLFGESSVDLGGLVASGVANYATTPWPFIVPAVAASMLLLWLHGLSAALTRPERATVGLAASGIGGSGVPSWQTEPDPDETEALVAANAGRAKTVVDLTAADLESTAGTIDLTDPVHADGEIGLDDNDDLTAVAATDTAADAALSTAADAALSTAAVTATDTAAVAAFSTAADAADEASSTTTTDADGRQADSSPITTAADPGDSDTDHAHAPEDAETDELDLDNQDLDDDDLADEDLDDDDDLLDGDDLDDGPMALEATRTVELRPSTLRAAGITAPVLPESRTTLSPGWSKPVLAPRPPGPVPAAEEPDVPSDHEQSDSGDPDSGGETTDG